ncbi:MAG: hypothetical protein JXA37_07935 [Chloroflexia bacterium]|nr:hypothetical protein [Chloroflexia bacterium]
MRRRMQRCVLALLMLGLLFGLSLIACRVEQQPDPVVTATTVPAATNRPTRPAATKAAEPTASTGVIPATPTRENVNLALTLMHTGQIQGEVDPCG